MNNIPVHNPLYPDDGRYGSDNYEAIAVLLKVERENIARLLQGTPFQPLGPYVWVEIMVLHDASGIKPYQGGGVIVPAVYNRYEGGYYAFCYVNTDDSLGLGREAYGYPKKYAHTYFQRTGNAVVGSYRSEVVNLELSVVLGRSPQQELPLAPRFPHLLLQRIPSANHSEALFSRVLLRNTSESSSVTELKGEGAVRISAGSSGNELAWLGMPEVVGGLYLSGQFKSGNAQVIGVESVSEELEAMIRHNGRQS